jgi:cytidylate kinase
VLQAGVDLADEDKVVAVACAAAVQVGVDADKPWILVDGVAVDGPIREDDVTAAVSAVASIPAVRARLVAQQRQIIAAASQGAGIVVEGRDIGAVVAPDARLKVYLTASAEARARRRSSERSADLELTASDLARRDHLDSTRTVDPLALAPGAVVLDSTDLDVDQVVHRLVGMLGERQQA